MQTYNLSWLDVLISVSHRSRNICSSWNESYVNKRSSMICREKENRKWWEEINIDEQPKKSNWFARILVIITASTITTQQHNYLDMCMVHIRRDSSALLIIIIFINILLTCKRFEKLPSNDFSLIYLYIFPTFRIFSEKKK